MAEKQLETWQNSIPGTIIVKRFDHRGDFVRDEVINSGRPLHITAEERRLNSEMCANAEQDVFKNGFLTPVRLLEGTEDAREIASNPNILAEEDMRKLLRGHWKTLDSRVGQITNTAALERMLQIAKEEDVPLSKMDRIKSRLQEVSPANVVEVEVVGGGRPGPNRAVPADKI